MFSIVSISLIPVVDFFHGPTRLRYTSPNFARSYKRVGSIIKYSLYLLDSTTKNIYTDPFDIQYSLLCPMEIILEFIKHCIYNIGLVGIHLSPQMIRTPGLDQLFEVRSLYSFALRLKHHHFLFLVHALL